MSSYRVHYKKGGIEFEVESTDKDYVDQMLQKFLSPHASQTLLRKLPKQKGKTLQTARGKKG